MYGFDVSAVSTGYNTAVEGETNGVDVHAEVESMKSESVRQGEQVLVGIWRKRGEGSGMQERQAEGDEGSQVSQGDWQIAGGYVQIPVDRVPVGLQDEH